MGASAHLQVFGIIQLLDVVTTLIGRRFGAVEANGFVDAVLGGGWWAFVIVKVVFAALVVTFLVIHGGRLWSRTIHGVNTAYGAVIGWNLGLLLGGWPFTMALLTAALVFILPWMAQISLELTRRHVMRAQAAARKP